MSIERKKPRSRMALVFPMRTFVREDSLETVSAVMRFTVVPKEGLEPSRF